MVCMCSGGERHLFMLNNLFWSENVFQKDSTSLVRGFRGKIFKYILFFDKDKEVLTFSFLENWLLLPSFFGLALEHILFSQSTGWLQDWIQNFSCKKEKRNCFIYQSYEQQIKEAYSPSSHCKHHHLHCTPGKWNDCMGWQDLRGVTRMQCEKGIAPTLLSYGYSTLVITLPELVSTPSCGMSIWVTNLAVQCSSGASARSRSTKYLFCSRWG